MKIWSFILIGLLLLPMVFADDCQDLKDIIEANNEKQCGDSNYKSFADIDKDGIISLIDMILVDANSEDSQWCLERMNDNTNPCETGTIVNTGETNNNYNSLSGGSSSSTSITPTSSPETSGSSSDYEEQITYESDIQDIAKNFVATGSNQMERQKPNIILLWISALVAIGVIGISIFFLIKNLRNSNKMQKGYLS